MMLLFELLFIVGWTGPAFSFLLPTSQDALSLRAQASFRPRLSRSMFSGIVEDIGVVDGLIFNKLLTMWDGAVSEGVELTISSRKATEEASIGCSIAVNGVCLTATNLTDTKFTVNLAPETLRRTNLGTLEIGSKVNVERALRADGRNSGHFVQGHVDDTGTLIERWVEGDSLWMRVQVTDDLLRYIVPKGFICIDGTSLTVCDVAKFSAKGMFPLRRVGDKVNIEVDIIGKLVETSLSGTHAALESTIGQLRSDLLGKDRDIESLKQVANSQAMAIQLLSQRVHDLEDSVRSLGNILS